jgi:hypothetical protein
MVEIHLTIYTNQEIKGEGEEGFVKEKDLIHLSFQEKDIKCQIFYFYYYELKIQQKHATNSLFIKLKNTEKESDFLRVGHQLHEVYHRKYENYKHDFTFKKLKEIYSYCEWRNFENENYPVTFKFLFPCVEKCENLIAFHFYEGCLYSARKSLNGDLSFKNYKCDINQYIQDISNDRQKDEEDLKSINAISEIIEKLTLDFLKNLQKDSTLSIYYGFGCDKFWELPIYSL